MYSRLAAPTTTPIASPYSSFNTSFTSGYSPYRYGSYGGYGGGMYNSYGGMGGMGAMGGLGGMYGSGGMYGAGGYGGAMQRDPNDPNSLTNRFNTSTQATFQMLEGVVGAFGGFAQMLESTYMATHSSFFAMVSVAEQFSHLRDTLGSVLGIFTVMRWIRTLLARLTGRPLPADAMALTPAAFARFEGRSAAPDAKTAPKPSRKPLLFFVLAAFGLPYLMGKLIRTMAASHEEEQRRQLMMVQQQQQSQQLQQAASGTLPLDPSKLEFCRVLYDYTPQQDAQQLALAGGATAAAAGGPMDLAVKRDDLVVVLSKADPMGTPSDWWQCRTRDGRVGYLPATFLRKIELPTQQSRQPQQLTSLMTPRPPASVADSLESSRAKTIVSTTTAATSPIAPSVVANPVMAEKAAAQKQAKAVSSVPADSFAKSTVCQ